MKIRTYHLLLKHNVVIARNAINVVIASAAKQSRSVIPRLDRGIQKIFTGLLRYARNDGSGLLRRSTPRNDGTWLLRGVYPERSRRARNDSLIKFLTLFIFSLLFIPMSVQAANVVNVYNWSGYIPEKVLQLFTQQTGITVNYSTFDSNQELYAKLKASPNAGYDVIVPSANFVTKMRNQHMLQPLDKRKILNIKNLNPWLMNRSFDPHNRYSIPYLWGTTAIMINIKYFPHAHITSWQQLWNKRFHNKILLLNSAREVFAIALKSLGYSLNDTNPKHLRQAYQKLIKLLPNVKMFNGEASQTIFMDEDATIGITLSGDAYLAQQQNPNLRYIFPREGVNIWIDNIAIPKNAPHLQNAYKFINFLLQPKIAKMIALDMNFSSPNLAAIRLMPKKIRDNHILYPTKAELKHSEFQQDVGAANHLYQHYWELLKING